MGKCPLEVHKKLSGMAAAGVSWCGWMAGWVSVLWKSTKGSLVWLLLELVGVGGWLDG